MEFYTIQEMGFIFPKRWKTKNLKIDYAILNQIEIYQTGFLYY